MPNLKSNAHNHKYTMLYAAGEVYISSFIDTLTCQAYFNPNIVTILQQLLRENSEDEDEEVLRVTMANPDLVQSNLKQIPIPESCVVSLNALTHYLGPDIRALVSDSSGRQTHRPWNL